MGLHAVKQFLFPTDRLLRTGIYMSMTMLDPCEMNVAIAALTNYFFTTLSKEDFVCLSIFLRELSKSMIGTSIFDGLCSKEDSKIDL